MEQTVIITKQRLNEEIALSLARYFDLKEGTLSNIALMVANDIQASTEGI